MVYLLHSTVESLTPNKRLIIDEFSPELVYIQGETNIVADALSRLEIIDNVDYNLSDTQNLDTFYADLCRSK